MTTEEQYMNPEPSPIPLTGAQRQERYRNGQKRMQRRKREHWLTDHENEQVNRLLDKLRGAE